MTTEESFPSCVQSTCWDLLSSPDKLFPDCSNKAVCTSQAHRWPTNDIQVSWNRVELWAKASGPLEPLGPLSLLHAGEFRSPSWLVRFLQRCLCLTFSQLAPGALYAPQCECSFIHSFSLSTTPVPCQGLKQQGWASSSHRRPFPQWTLSPQGSRR